jgi:hypothetical protein
LRHALPADNEALHAARQLLQLLDHHKRLDFEVWHVASAWSTPCGATMALPRPHLMAAEHSLLLHVTSRCHCTMRTRHSALTSCGARGLDA